MLEYLRRDASKFIFKVLLGFIAVVFIAYFGFSYRPGSRGRGAGSGATAPIATVNGVNLPAGEFNQQVQRQLSVFQQLGKDSIPPETAKMVETQILQRLIGEEVLAQAAYRYGLRVTDSELAQEILSNPSFQKDGKFNEGFYLDQFKPYYERTYGEDFEYSLRQELLAEKLKNVLEKGALVSAQQVEDQLALIQTKLKLKRLEIDLKSPQADWTQEKAVEMAKQWIADKQAKKSVAELLKNPALKEEEIELKPLYELQMILGREDSYLVLSCLLSLKESEVCDEPFRVGDKVIAVELLERKTEASTPEQKQALYNQLAQAKKNQLLSAASDFLMQKAKIEMYLSQ